MNFFSIFKNFVKMQEDKDSIQKEYLSDFKKLVQFLESTDYFKYRNDNIVKLLQVDANGNLWFYIEIRSDQRSFTHVCVYTPYDEYLHILGLEFMEVIDIKNAFFFRNNLYVNGEKRDDKTNGLYRWHSVDGTLEYGFFKHEFEINLAYQIVPYFSEVGIAPETF